MNKSPIWVMPQLYFCLLVKSLLAEVAVSSWVNPNPSLQMLSLVAVMGNSCLTQGE
jgi:hypothetical protein